MNDFNETALSPKTTELMHIYKLTEAVKASTRPTQVQVSALRWGSRPVLTSLTEKPSATDINL